MSYILNALRKSEQERQALQPETVTDRILAQQPGQSRKTGKWIGAIIISNIIIVAGFIWYAHKTPAPPVTQEQPHSAPVQSGAREPANLPTVENDAVKLAEKPKNEAIKVPKPLAKLPESAPSAVIEQAAANRPTESRMQSSALASKKPIPAPVPDALARVEKPSDNRTDTADVPARQLALTMTEPVRTKALEPEMAPMRGSEIPYLEELPYDFRHAIPKMTINVFVYSSDPAERFVMIDMVKYKIGQHIKETMELKEIRPESLVLGYENQIFQIARP